MSNNFFLKKCPDISGNSYLGEYGKSTTNNNVVYFAKNETSNKIELNSKYSAYWDSYEVSEEEYNDAIVVEGVGTLTQSQLWNVNYLSQAYNEARRIITEITYQNMASHKGIGVNEVSNSHSYYGAYNNGSTNAWNWFQSAQATTETVSYARAWNSDYVLIGHSNQPFIRRGGGADDIKGAGVLYSYVADGYLQGRKYFSPSTCFLVCLT